MATVAPSTSAPAAAVVAPPAPTAGDLDKTIAETIRRQSVTWTVADTGEKLDLSISHVRRLFASPTKRGVQPTDRDCWLFLHLCKARGLNPYVGDAFLVGYDESDGGAKFSLITSHQALLKRAEASGKKKGMESGVITLDEATGEVHEHPGDFYLPDKEKLVGGWAKVYRADWDHPAYERLPLTVYNKGYGRWRIDPAGMIVKCSEASAHRLAFPKETAGMYVREEIGSAEMQPEGTPQPLTKPLSKVEQMAADVARSSGDGSLDDAPPEPEQQVVAPPDAVDPPAPDDANQAADTDAHFALREWANGIIPLGTAKALDEFEATVLPAVPEPMRPMVQQMVDAKRLIGMAADGAAVATAERSLKAASPAAIHPYIQQMATLKRRRLDAAKKPPETKGQPV